MGRKSTIENSIIGLTILSLVAVTTLVLNVNALRALKQHDFFGSREFANEYIVFLYQGRPKQTKEKFELINELVHDHLRKCKKKFSPDHFELARSLQSKHLLIIGFDNIDAKGSTRKIENKKNDLERKLNGLKKHCWEILSEDAKKGLDFLLNQYSLEEDKGGVKTMYYSVSLYSSLYREYLTNSSKDGN